LNKKKLTAGHTELNDSLDFLSRAAIGFVELSPEEDIYVYIVEKLKELVGDPVVYICSYDKESDAVTLRALKGIGNNFKALLKILGRDPFKMSFPLNDEIRGEIMSSSAKLRELSGGFSRLSVGKIPDKASNAIMSLLGLGKFYGAGIIREGELLGTAIIVTRKGKNLENKRTIETFLNQVSIALEHRRAEQELERYRERLEDLVEERTAELKEAFRRIKRTQRQLAQAQLASGMGHVIKTELNLMSGLIALLKRNALQTKDTDSLKTLASLEETISGMLGVFEKLLVLSKSMQLNEGRMSPTAAVRKVLHGIEFGGEINIIENYQKGLPEIYVDLAMFDKVVKEIIQNAVYELRKIEGEKTIKLSLAQTRNDIEFIIWNSGSSISESMLETIFDPFQTTKNASIGTGMGLAIVTKIVDAHEWNIRAINRDGGVAFILGIPIAKEVK